MIYYLILTISNLIFLLIGYWLGQNSRDDMFHKLHKAAQKTQTKIKNIGQTSGPVKVEPWEKKKEREARKFYEQL